MVVLAVLAAGPAAQAHPTPAVAPTADQAPAPHSAHVQAVNDFRLALASGDGEAAAALLAADATIFEEGHVEASKAEYVAAHLPSDLQFARATSFEVTRRQSGVSGDLAYVTTEGRTRGEFKGKTVNSISTETILLRRDPEGWRIVHIHWSSRTAPV